MFHSFTIKGEWYGRIEIVLQTVQGKSEQGLCFYPRLIIFGFLSHIITNNQFFNTTNKYSDFLVT